MPATVDPDRLEARLDAPLVHADRMGSTNDRARRLAAEGATNGTLVVADRQTAGRGRTGNVWVSPPGGIWTTTVLRPELTAAAAGRLTVAGGVAAAEAVAAAGADPSLKWPNDVLLGTGKVGGVLTELVVEGIPVAGKPVSAVLPGTDPDEATLDAVLLGIGINADLDPAALEMDREVATLRAAVGGVDPTDVAATLHDAVLRWAERVEDRAGFEELLDRYRELDATLGRRVRVAIRGGSETLVGEAVALTEDGALVVETDEGRRTVTEGECERLRPV